MSEPIAGKFLLEILTKGMYSNPMHVYREYIQNSSDSIDRAIESGILQATEAEIHIFIDDKERNIVIRDNGLGIPLDIAKTKLTLSSIMGKRSNSQTMLFSFPLWMTVML